MKFATRPNIITLLVATTQDNAYVNLLQINFA